MKTTTNRLTWAKSHLRMAAEAETYADRADHLRFALSEVQDAASEIAEQLRKALAAQSAKD